MADNKYSNRVPESKEERAALAAAEHAEAQKYVADAVARRAARFAEPEVEVTADEVREQRAALMASLTPDNLRDNGVNGNPQKPVDNPIPVRHNGEEPGEPDLGEDTELVKVRPDVQDYTPQPEGHRVPEAQQLNGETGDGGVPPADPLGKEKGLKELADGTVIDSEGEQNTTQPEGHQPEGVKATADAGESDEDRLARLREEY